MDTNIQTALTQGYNEAGLAHIMKHCKCSGVAYIPCIRDGTSRTHMAVDGTWEGAVADLEKMVKTVLFLCSEDFSINGVEWQRRGPESRDISITDR
jgi:hypothetical protein